MAETSWPTVSGSRVVSDDQFELMSAFWSADGVEIPPTTSPVFGDSSGRQAKVRAGVDAIVGGHGYASGASDITKTVTANASGQTRWDAVVLRLDRTTWAVTSEVKAGTAGAGVPPALTRNARGSSAGVWEIPLAMVRVLNGASTISASDVTDIAWRSSGDTVVTTSTNPLQPPATDYSRLRHSDTGHEFDSVAGAWRRSPWYVARGVVGGKRNQQNVIIQSNVTATEAVAELDSGAVALEANRRYEITVRIKISASTNDTYFALRFRESNLSGTVVGYFEQIIRGAGSYHCFEFTQEITTSSASTKTYVATIARLGGGNLAVLGGTSSAPAGVWVKDVGPSVPNVVTVV